MALFKKGVNAIYDTCFSVVTGNTIKGGMITVVEVRQSSVGSQDISTVFEIRVVHCLLVTFYQMRKNWQPVMLGYKVTKHPLIPASMYVWCILHKHLQKVSSTDFINPKQGSSG